MTSFSLGDAIARGVLILAIMLAVVGVAADSRAAVGQKSRTRDDVLAALAVAEQTLAAQPDNAPARQQLARLLYESGDFWRAAEVIRPALAVEGVSPDAIALAADLEYLLGHYPEAERLYRDLLANAQADSQSRVKAKVALGFIYYQTNRFDRFKELEFGPGVKFPGDKVIRSFERPPYGLTWHAEQRLSELPFLMTDPLPVMTVEYDGHPVHVLFDTGADMCILDTELAEKFAVKEESWTVGAFGGGKLGKMGYGKLRSVTVGNVSLADVPILIMPTQRFSPAFADGKYPIGGIIGTALIRQFLATLDYEHGKLVLRERSARARDELRKQLDDRIAAEVPFVLTSTHWMMARGTLNGRDGLTFFVDSGLASDAAFAAPPQTLRYLGIPEPKQKLDPKAIGGGGGAWASGEFAIHALGLGSLRRQQLKGEYGSMAAGTYWQNGFIQDGLISHGFLRKYDSWTIDFDAMKYLFAAKATQ